MLGGAESHGARRASARVRLLAVACCLGCAALSACGSSSTTHASTVGTAPFRAAAASASSPIPAGHPQAVQPTAGQAAPLDQSGPPTAPPVGDPTAHAPSLSEVKLELRRLNLCGGATTAAGAAPIVTGGGPGFVADPGTQQTEGQLPLLTRQLDRLGKSLGVAIYGISGYRTPAHSVAVGGFANDPHTLGEAEDIGVGSLLRSSAAQISEAQLAAFGLYRPFDPSDNPANTEVNHVQLIPASGVLSLAQAQATFDPDPSCK